MISILDARSRTLVQQASAPRLDESRAEELRPALEAKGLRYTRQRSLVYQFMAVSGAQGYHPTAEAVFHGVKPHLPSISLATVYKALEALEGCGLLRRLRFTNDSAHFDFRVDDHHHAYCQDSRRIYDVECCDPEALLAQLEIPKGWLVKDFCVDVNGWCAECGHDHQYDLHHYKRQLARNTALESETPADEHLRSNLEEAGLRFTQQRRVVAEFMRQARESHVHPTAEAVFQGVKAHMPSISLATVYKSLEAMEECGMIRRLKLSEESAHFDGRIDPHHHLNCTHCNALADVDQRKGADLGGLMKLPAGFLVAGIHVSMRGTCPTCR